MQPLPYTEKGGAPGRPPPGRSFATKAPLPVGKEASVRSGCVPPSECFREQTPPEILIAIYSSLVSSPEGTRSEPPLGAVEDFS
jgi:hypothetical protein